MSGAGVRARRGELEFAFICVTQSSQKAAHFHRRSSGVKREAEAHLLQSQPCPVATYTGRNLLLYPSLSQGVNSGGFSISSCLYL